MLNEKYSVSQYSVNTILGFVEAGDIAIPEIQRPFVWKRAQVRDLIDSLCAAFSSRDIALLVYQAEESDQYKDKAILVDIMAEST